MNPWETRSWPLPPQEGQSTGFVPGVAPVPSQSSQAWSDGTRTSTLSPETACSRVISRE